MLRIEIATMQDATKISVHDYLGFGEVEKPQIDAVELEFGVYVGERNANGKPHGRGVAICYWGEIYMHYFDDGQCASGNMISMDTSSGKILVGAFYRKDGEQCLRGTVYDKKGTILNKVD